MSTAPVLMQRAGVTAAELQALRWERINDRLVQLFLSEDVRELSDVDLAERVGIDPDNRDQMLALAGIRYVWDRECTKPEPPEPVAHGIALVFGLVVACALWFANAFGLLQ